MSAFSHIKAPLDIYRDRAKEIIVRHAVKKTDKTSNTKRIAVLVVFRDIFICSHRPPSNKSDATFIALF